MTTAGLDLMPLRKGEKKREQERECRTAKTRKREGGQGEERRIAQKSKM